MLKLAKEKEKVQRHQIIQLLNLELESIHIFGCSMERQKGRSKINMKNTGWWIEV